MKTYFESLLFFFLFPLEGGTLELWRGKRANFLKKVKFSSLDSSSSLHSFLSLAYNDEYTRADDNKRKNTPAECEESLQQSKRFLPRVVVRGHRFVRSKRAGFFGRYFFFFWSFRERKGRQEEEGEEEEAKDKNFGTREEKNQFFFKKRELERTRDSAKNVAHFSSARFCLNEKQTEKENAATKMMARAMSAGRFDFRERIIDFFFEEVRLVFYSSFFGKKREKRKRKREVDSRRQKKSSRRSECVFLLDDNAAFFRRKCEEREFFFFPFFRARK